MLEWPFHPLPQYFWIMGEGGGHKILSSQRETEGLNLTGVEAGATVGAQSRPSSPSIPLTFTKFAFI